MEEKKMSEQESLQLITDMIRKVKGDFHETGDSAILWGSVIAVCGLVSFAEAYWRFSIGFDIWYLTLAALVPQIWISIRESRQQKVKTHKQEAMNAVWFVYGISVFALIFYFQTVPRVTDRILEAQGVHLLQQNPEGIQADFHYFIPSTGSLLLLLYAIPTVVTGMAYKFRPMLIGGVICYLLFFTSCFTETAYDRLLNGLAGILNWLIPGLILRRRFYQQKKQ